MVFNIVILVIQSRFGGSERTAPPVEDALAIAAHREPAYRMCRSIRS
jgi:hypothetical protein